MLPIAAPADFMDLLRRDGIRDPRVLDAMARVDRARFVPASLRNHAWDDNPLPIGGGQTISQPSLVAWMTERLGVRPGHRVLEIGTGSGYQTAILAALGAKVYTLEVRPDLAEQARLRLMDVGGGRVHFACGDGARGWPEAAPFDRILLACAPGELPQALLDQLAPEGRLLAPVGEDNQHIEVWDRTPDGFARTSCLPVRFVPMVDGDGRLVRGGKKTAE